MVLLVLFAFDFRGAPSGGGREQAPPRGNEQRSASRVAVTAGWAGETPPNTPARQRLAKQLCWRGFLREHTDVRS